MATFNICKLAKPDKIIRTKTLARLIQFPVFNTKWIAKLQELLWPILPEYYYYFGFTQTIGWLKKQTTQNALQSQNCFITYPTSETCRLTFLNVELISPIYLLSWTLNP